VKAVIVRTRKNTAAGTGLTFASTRTLRCSSTEPVNRWGRACSAGGPRVAREEIFEDCFTRARSSLEGFAVSDVSRFKVGVSCETLRG